MFVASPLPLTDIHLFLGNEESGLCIIAFELLNSQRSLKDFIKYAKFILMTHSSSLKTQTLCDSDAVPRKS